MISIALPKGRLGEKVYSLFEKAGYSVDSSLFSLRQLVFTNEEKDVRYFWVKPTDVPIYVTRGVADLGAVGLDTLSETKPDVYELLDLKLGKCSLCIASTKDYSENNNKRIKVATKYPHLSKEYYLKKGKDIEIIKLSGSIEIAPLLGLSDCICDIVETGTTLKENNLFIYDTVMQISAYLISNKSSFLFHKKEILEIKEKLEKIVEEKND